MMIKYIAPALAGLALLCLVPVVALAQKNTEAFIVMLPVTCLEKDAAIAFFQTKSAKVVGWGMFEDKLKNTVFMNADGEFWFTATLATGRTCIFTNGSDWTPEELPTH
jgi:dihydroorotase-like cyclic amidohydrolase